MSVSFCITEQETQRKNFRKKVMLNIKENKIKISEQKNITKALEEANEVLRTEIITCKSKIIRLEYESENLRKELKEKKIRS